jgi:hypothetical protein
MKLRFLAGLAAAALLAIGLSPAALAQTLPKVVNVGATDVFNDVVGGSPKAGSVYATAAQIAGVPGYTNLGAATTGNTYTFGNSTTDIFMQPAGTLAAVTLTAAANPGDGQRECFLSTQTTTALTWNANTGQTIANAPTAGVAMVPACMTFVASLSEWLRSP